MALYLLDGNILSALEDRSKPDYQQVRRKLADLADGDRVAVSIVSACEYQHGIAKARGELRAGLLKAWATFLEVFEVLPLTMNAARHYGMLRSRYEREVGATTRASSRHSSDFLLAATALDTNATLITSDRIFRSLSELEPNLLVEDWRGEA